MRAVKTADQRANSRKCPGTRQPGGLAAGQPAGDLPASPEPHLHAALFAKAMLALMLGRSPGTTWTRSGHVPVVDARAHRVEPAGRHLLSDYGYYYYYYYYYYYLEADLR